MSCDIKISDLLKKNRIHLKINRVISKFNNNEKPEDLLDHISFDRLKLLNLYVNREINSSAEKYRLSEMEFCNNCNKYAKYHPEIETTNNMSDAYYMINSNGDIVKSVDGEIKKYGNILLMSNAELINLWK